MPTIKDRLSHKSKKEKKNVPSGIVHIQSTFNNTIVTVTDLAGNIDTTIISYEYTFYSGQTRNCTYQMNIILLICNNFKIGIPINQGAYSLELSTNSASGIVTTALVDLRLPRT